MHQKTTCQDNDVSETLSYLQVLNKMRVFKYKTVKAIFIEMLIDIIVESR